MKQDQQQQAQQLFFQTDLSKTEIASELGIGRRTLHYWIRQHNWDKLKTNAEMMPSFLAGNCYQVLHNYTRYLLSEERSKEPVTPKEINALYKLTLTVNKLRNTATINESMEVLNLFTDDLKHKAPKLATQLAPHISRYIESRITTENKPHNPAGITNQGYIPTPNTAAQDLEARLDAEDFLAWAMEQEEKAQVPATPVATEGPSAPAPALNFPSALAPTPAPALNFPSAPTPALPSAPALPSTPAPAFISSLAPMSSLVTPPEKVKVDLRKMLRGTATKGPSKNWRKQHAAA